MITPNEIKCPVCKRKGISKMVPAAKISANKNIRINLYCKGCGYKVAWGILGLNELAYYNEDMAELDCQIYPDAPNCVTE